MTRDALSPHLAARAAALPAGPKLAVLMGLATALLMLQSALVLGMAAASGLVLCLLVIGPAGLRAAASAGLVLAIAAVALFTLALEGAGPAITVLLRLCALVLFAQLFTGTTRASAVQDAIVAALRPFERLPFVSAEKAGLALAVALRSLPKLGAAMAELREAQAARGFKASVPRLIVPLVARILKDARETAEAIDARSWSGSKERGR